MQLRPTSSPPSRASSSFEWPDLSDDDADDALSASASEPASSSFNIQHDPTRSTRDRSTPHESRRVNRLRTMQLGLACCMSIGSHFGAYMIGPVRTSLHASEHGFASLVSSFQLVNTLTPLVSNAFVLRYGAPKTALGATATVLLGQAIVVWAQRNGTQAQGQALSGMILGLFCFGLGLAPIAVCQESIILKQNHSNSKSVARSVAIGLLFGKTAAFIAALTAEPMISISPRLPFMASFGVALFSFACCVAYNMIEKTLPTLENNNQLHHDNTYHPIESNLDKSSTNLYKNESKLNLISSLKQISCSTTFGDLFWLYTMVCFLAGSMYSTIHLSSSLIQALYKVNEKKASAAASLILFSSTILYPIVGTMVDLKPHLLRNFYFTVPVMILMTYIIMLYFTWLVPWWASTLPAAIGIGTGPLLLVIVVPRLVERSNVPTALSIHKSVEMSGAVLFQTWTGWISSSSSSTSSSSSSSINDQRIDHIELSSKGYSRVLHVLSLLVVCQLGVVLFWWWYIVPLRQRREEDSRLEISLAFNSISRRQNETEPTDWNDQEEQNELENEIEFNSFLKQNEIIKESQSIQETNRGKMAIKIAMALVIASWVSFVLNLGLL
ncbi:hypothetical protein OIO90_000658 [Microbotryomycetes sp. JL221]|nr:hypothetical protein OIO90_000658 [Microbotryomycetes sp. JL221]